MLLSASLLLPSIRAARAARAVGTFTTVQAGEQLLGAKVLPQAHSIPAILAMISIKVPVRMKAPVPIGSFLQAQAAPRMVSVRLMAQIQPFPLLHYHLLRRLQSVLAIPLRRRLLRLHRLQSVLSILLRRRLLLHRLLSVPSIPSMFLRHHHPSVPATLLGHRTWVLATQAPLPVGLVA
jgi:hypothetical protein